mmetsp:Transcript_23992/g.50574  ORF Transcript_23992/g.50574 Transcript_23992/m.50574 type:complete len:318 (-) Transcript_23992:899-1852(-)
MIARLIDELCFGLISGFGTFPRPQENLRHAHRPHDADDLLGTSVVGTANEHFGQLRIQRQFCHLSSQIGQISLVVQCAEVIQHFQSPHESFRGGRIHEIEMDEVVDAQFFECQYHIGHFAPQYLGVCRFLQIFVEGLLRVESKTLPGTRPTGTSGALSRRGPRDGTYQEGLHPNTRIVHFLFRKSRVDDVDDTVDGERRFGDVGGNDNFATRLPSHNFWGRRRLEYFALLGRRQRRVQGIHHQFGGVFPISHFLGPQTNFLACLLDLLFSRQKDENVPGSLAFMDLNGRPHRGFDVIPLGFCRVEHFDREGPSGHFQ